MDMLGAGAEMHLLRDSETGLVKNVILPVAQFQSLPVQIREIVEHAINQKVFLDEADQALDLPFGKRMAGLTQLRFEAHGTNERFIIRLPNGIPVQIAVQNNALHVVRQNIFRYAHPLERMNHPDEKVFLLGVGEELHIALPTVMTHHPRSCLSSK